MAPRASLFEAGDIGAYYSLLLRKLYSFVFASLLAGGQIDGKSTCEDLCQTSSSFTSVSGPVLNPFDINRSAGGSSSGSAVLVSWHLYG